jgi:hypothetical protein
MATTTLSRYRVPIPSRVFELSRLHEHWMAAAYVLVAPAGSSRRRSAPSAVDVSSGPSVVGEHRHVDRIGRTA